jgi:hypothetical protein
MGVIIASQTGLSVAANSKSVDQVSGSYQFLPFPAELIIYGRASVTGMNLQLFVNGKAMVNDLPFGFFGATGSLSKKDHEMSSIFPVPEGSRVEVYCRNTTAGAVTADFIVEAEPLEME